MKLICIGDSLTFGYGVRPSQRWTRLCAQETGWEIVNEGISGDTTGGMLVRLRALLAERPLDAVALFIGPEGGFAPEEIGRARAAGAQIATLGPRILRTETAGLCALSALMFAAGALD